MSLKKLFLIIFGIQFVLAIGLGILTMLLFQNEGNLNKSREVQFQSYMLADELRQSSDDLTRLGRAFVATGNPEYEREYFAILDIRNGKAPRPQAYNRIYWDFVAATGEKPRPDGETISLQELMKQEGFTDEEFAKLTEAQKNSDGLVVAETIAMNAVKGLFDDGKGNFTVNKAPDREMALDLVFNETYHKNKANIMKPIDDFYVLFEKRTAENVAMYQQRSTILLWSIISLILIIMGMFVFSFVIIQRQVVNKLQTVVQASRKIAETDLVAFASEIDQIADGDLTRHALINPSKLGSQSKDEVGQMAQAVDNIIGSLLNVSNSFQKMTSNFHNVLVEVNNNSNSVTSAASQLARASEQSGEATSQIATTIQQVALGTAQQTAGITKTSGSVEQMGRAIDGVARGAQEQAKAISQASQITTRINTAIEQVANNAQAVTRDSAQAAAYSRDGAKTVKETITGMEAIRTKVGLSAAKVEEMGVRSEEIGAIVETIEDIASQTNLLALNAAIEAARAGEQGKGFAVVADEVRKLAERSSLATKEIAALIKGIQKTVSEAVTAMQASAAEVESGVTRAHSAGEVLENILGAAEAVYKQAEDAGNAAAKVSAAAAELVEAVDAVSAVVEQNTAATEEMAANSTELTQAIENIASVSEQNSAAVEEVSASTEEVSAQVEEVSASATSLMEMAQQLQQVVARFKLTVK
jgi:methyl-accepting chemotaxis protein